MSITVKELIKALSDIPTVDQDKTLVLVMEHDEFEAGRKCTCDNFLHYVAEFGIEFRVMYEPRAKVVVLALD